MRESYPASANTSTEKADWISVTRRNPCPICEGTSWCSVAENGTAVCCRRQPNGATITKNDKHGAPCYVHVLGDNRTDPEPRERPARAKPTGPAVPAADVATRHAVYTAVLDALTLGPYHRETLRQRGLDDEVITANGYRSIPEKGPTVVKPISAQFNRDTLLTVPGFFAQGAQLRFWSLPGLLIPVRDVAGQIVALLSRPDKKLDDSKYLWVSSKSKGGSSPGAPCHVPSGKRVDDGLVRLTEGALKADVATGLNGMLTVGAAGVANWRPALPMLKELGAETVRLAFDCDATVKASVALATIGCCEGLTAAGFNVELERWPWKHGKGIDDVLSKGKSVEVLADDALDTFLRVLRDGIDLPTNTPPAAETKGEAAPLFLGGWDEVTKDRPIVRMTADYHVVVTDAANSLSRGPDVYTRGGELARVIRHPGSKPEDKGIRRAAGSPVIAPMDADVVRVLLSKAARFERFDERSKDWKFTPPTRDIAASVLGLKEYPDGRELIGIVEAPTLRPDGSLLDTPGFDPATGLLYVPNAVFPAVPGLPTELDAKTALQVILRLVTDFPFETDCDRAAWLSYLLSVICRSAIEGPVPMFMFSANAAGIGKTCLAEMAGLIATGRYPAMDGYTRDDAEMEKRLTALAIAGDRCVILDNIETGFRIGGAALDRAITAKGAFRGRILGSSKMSPCNVPWSAVLSATGNNIGTRTDLRRRVVPCYLKATMAKPEERDPEAFAIFKESGHNLEQYVLDNRPALVAAALTIVRAYIVAGRPKMKLTPIDFPAWSGLIREAVAWVYDFDPAGSRDRLEGEDETSANQVQLVIAWRLLCEASDADNFTLEEPKKAINRGLTTAEAATMLADFHRRGVNVNVIQAFSGFAPKGSSTPDTTRLSMALRKENGSVTACGTLINDSRSSGYNRWRVENWTAPEEK